MARFEKSKQFWYGVFLLLAIAYAIWIIIKPSTTISREELKQRAVNNIGQQFCNIIYPNISSCVTFKKHECKGFIEEIINGCITSWDYELPENITNNHGKQSYIEASSCAEAKAKSRILEQFMIESQECYQRLS